jgi:uncharacterized protein YndB with AHSA1/START domain
MDETTKIIVKATVNAPVEKVWQYWTEPEHIKKWNHASDDWHTTKAENKLEVGGSFSSRMEAKDKSFGFDFGGTYTSIKPQKHIAYSLHDSRKVTIDFEHNGDATFVTETFEAEKQNPIEMQRDGWQAILNNFKKYTENN